MNKYFLLFIFFSIFCQIVNSEVIRHAIPQKVKTSFGELLVKEEYRSKGLLCEVFLAEPQFITTPIGKLRVSHLHWYNSKIQSLYLSEKTQIKTSLGYLTCSHELSFYENGTIRGISLEPQVINTSVGPIQTNGTLSFHDNGQLKGIDNQLSCEIVTNIGKIILKNGDIRWYRNGNLENIKLSQWRSKGNSENEGLSDDNEYNCVVKTNVGDVKILGTVDWYENGNLKSVFTYKENTIKTPIGILSIKDKIQFHENGVLKTITLAASFKKYGANTVLNFNNKGDIENIDSSIQILSSTEIDKSMLSGATLEELRIIRNSIYAKYGRKFKDKKIDDYFKQFKWYIPKDNFIETELSNIEKKNVSIISKYENELNSVNKNEEGLNKKDKTTDSADEISIDNTLSVNLTQVNEIISKVDFIHNNQEYTIIYSKNGKENQYYFMYLLPYIKDAILNDIYKNALFYTELNDYAGPAHISKVVLDDLIKDKNKNKYKTQHEVIIAQLYGPSDDPEWFMYGFTPNNKFRELLHFIGYANVVERKSEYEYVIMTEPRGDDFSGMIWYKDMYLFNIEKNNLKRIVIDGCRDCRFHCAACSEMSLYKSKIDAFFNEDNNISTVPISGNLKIEKECNLLNRKIYFLTIKNGNSGWINGSSFKDKIKYSVAD
jgi:hypothetical protein